MMSENPENRMPPSHPAALRPADARAGVVVAADVTVALDLVDGFAGPFAIAPPHLAPDANRRERPLGHPRQFMQFETIRP